MSSLDRALHLARYLQDHIIDIERQAFKNLEDGDPITGQHLWTIYRRAKHQRARVYRYIDVVDPGF